MVSTYCNQSVISRQVRGGAGSNPVLTTKTKIMNYQITVSYGKYQLTYLAHRKKNTFYYDHNSPVGCSTIDIRNKRLVQYNKI